MLLDENIDLIRRDVDNQIKWKVTLACEPKLRGFPLENTNRYKVAEQGLAPRLDPFPPGKLSI